MNCQDITRLIDSGKFSTLSTSDKQHAEAHAMSCSHCTPLWIMHASVSATRAPPMPAELSVRCLTLAAAGKHAAHPRRVSRVTVVIAGFVVLAAAASMLAVGYFGPSTVTDQQETDAAVPEPVQSEAIIAADSPRTDAPEAAPTPAETKERPYSLPLIPALVGADEERQFQAELALRKAVELYPELTQGPEIDGHFVVSLNLKRNGTVLGNSLAIAHSTDEINVEMHRLQPLDGSQLFTDRGKNMPLENGQRLRGALTLAISVVPDNFDVSRANGRVEEIVRADHAHLMSADKSGWNTLTVLLAENGEIQRENVEFIGYEEQRSAGQKSPGPEVRAAEMARKLGVDVERIGLMGSTTIADSPLFVAGRRWLRVEYAWVRRADESKPKYGPDRVNPMFSTVDQAAALTVVEEVFPEVFLQADPPSDGPAPIRPIIVFTTDGKVIATGWVNMQANDFEQQILKISGVEIYSNTSVSLRTAAGKRVELHFAWEATPAQKEQIEKRRKAVAK
ncbi:MAG: hypothetical protein ABI645_13345 [Pseudomonadota bacterium]